jgi:hypothetical protein
LEQLVMAMELGQARVKGPVPELGQVRVRELVQEPVQHNQQQ